ncbi:cytochrome P450 3A27 [Chanos chanos]|uniref:unspecific monooxygenase n=1 Tax=Chanos chanos TaxID=29144 RepID=A0A6J2VU24_CHACN|nr:cytochrome P450 3A27-like [Chanos chanos]
MDILSFFLTETGVLLLLFLGLVVLYGYWPYGQFEKLGIPGPKPLPFFGTLLHYRKGTFTFDLECFRKYGKIWGIYEGRQPVLCVMDKTIIKTILIKEFYSLFTNRRNFRLNGPFNDGVFVAADEHWRRIRTVLSPSFTSGRLKEMFGIMKKNSNTLMKTLQRKADLGEAADFKELFGAYSMDVVTNTAFSVNVDSLNNPKDPFVNNLKKILKFDFLSPLFIITFVLPFAVPLMEKMNFTFFPSSVTDFFYASLKKIKSDRVANDHERRVDFMQLMVDSQKPEKNGHNKTEETGLNDREIISQAMTFIFAGYETTSSTLTFLFYNLATHPQTMRKLQEEIDQTFPNKAPVQYDKLMQMEYLDDVLNESLRLYPVVARLERICKKTVEINGVTIPKGTVVLVPTYALHRDPEIWTDPEKFNPDRFSKENKESIDPYTYLPFGAGPRNCIGMRFALVSMKLVITEILQRFDVHVCRETRIPLVLSPNGLMAPTHPIKLGLTPRSSSSSD